MKHINYTILILSTLMIGFNFTQINIKFPFSNDSFIAIVSILAALCLATLSLTFLSSIIIKEKYYGQKS